MQQPGIHGASRYPRPWTATREERTWSVKLLAIGTWTSLGSGSRKDAQNQWSPGRRGPAKTQDRPASGTCPQQSIKYSDVTCLAGTHTGSYGVEATGKPVEVRDFAVWRFKDGKVVEISATQDQFSFLKQIGYLPEGVHPAHYLIAPLWASRLEPVDLAERPLSRSVPIALDVAMPAAPAAAAEAMCRGRGINKPAAPSEL